ncbi:GntR family transcriptional regulator [Streptomyces sp. NPDC014676]|uniref:GntR family transcriptional regulator n=1 Tax=Streptomyces sp. NPDC014676 TaxID=3364879 RepID=UPI0036FDBD18
MRDGVWLEGAPARGQRLPKYYSIKQRLLEIIGGRKPGSAIPAERLLAVELRTSRTTLRKALQELVSEGRLDRIQGKGTFVVARPKVYQSLHVTSYTEDMETQGLTPASRILGIGHIPADEQLAGLLGLQTGDSVLRVERLRLAGGEPLAIESAHLSAQRFPGLRLDLTRYTSLYTVLTEQYGVRLAEAEGTIETSLATPAEAELLGVDVGSPMMLLFRHLRDMDGTPVEWVRSVCRGSRYKFMATLTRPVS